MPSRVSSQLSLVLAIALLAPAGCFNPEDPAAEEGTGGTGDAAESGGTNGANSSSDTDEPPLATDGPGSTDGPSDSSGVADLPPEITGFTVNGSETPSEMSASGIVTLDVDAVDDVGIDHVEFYDGDELVATANASPYLAEVLATSTENGVHEYSAVVSDTAGQTVESETVNLSVNVVGGALLELRDDLGAPRYDTPHITSSGGTNHLFSVTQSGSTAIVSYYQFDSNLSQLHSSDLSIPLSSDYVPTLTTTFSPSAGEVALAGFTTAGADLVLAAFVLEIGTDQFSRVDITPMDSVWPPIVAQDRTGAIVHSVGTNVMEKRANLTAAPSWETSTGDGSFVLDLATTSDADILVGFFGENCTEDSDRCIRKLAADGSVLWTQGMTLQPQYVRELPNGNIVAAGQHSESPFDPAIRILSSEGETLYSGDLASAIGRTGIHGLHVSADGGILIVGRANTFGATIAEQNAWAVRLAPNGTEEWNETYEIGNDSRLTDVTTSGDGRMFVVGTRDYDQGPGTGTGILAEIAL